MTLSLTLSAFAATKTQIQKDKEANQSKLDEAQSKADEIADSKADAEAEVDESQAQLVELLSNVAILEDDMKKKDDEIAKAETDYEAAEAEEKKQYKAMCVRIKYMYENGDQTSEYLDILLKANSLTDALNKAGYAEKIYEYDRTLLVNYQDIKNQVKDLKDQLEEDKSEMEELKQEYSEQEESLNSTIATQQATVENFSSKLASAKSEAKAYQKKIDDDNAEIAKIAAAEKAAAKKAAAEKAAAAKKAAAEKAKADADAEKAKADTGNTGGDNAETGDGGESGGSSGSDNPAPAASGSGTGTDIANFALQFVGNPYVPGGTSLTNGCDCSGFTSSVYAHFGYSIPRTSGSQAGCGTGVSYEDAQPGDIICYAGHVAIYIGNGKIVHASTQATGIKVSVATYRTILAIRRVA